ncbi:MAG: YncE family protein, partial [Gammaproteobacteria bacterium]|nr:YncE family protein [Gammaproteobacteria bacterium]
LHLLRVAFHVSVGEFPYAIAHDHERDRLFVTNQHESTVSVIDLKKRNELRRIEVGDYPEGIDFVSAHNQIYVANWFSNSISVIDAESLAVVAEIECGDGTRAFGQFVMQ